MTTYLTKYPWESSGFRRDQSSYTKSANRPFKRLHGCPWERIITDRLDYESEGRRVESCRALLLPCRRCFPLNSSQFYSPACVLALVATLAQVQANQLEPQHVPL